MQGALAGWVLWGEGQGSMMEAQIQSGGGDEEEGIVDFGSDRLALAPGGSSKCFGPFPCSESWPHGHPSVDATALGR